MSGWNYKRLADACVVIALAAGRVQLAHWRRGARVTIKADQSPVTAADQESERLILAGLGQALPGVPIVAEEASARGDVPPTGRRFLLVDPLDGTKEFISGSGEFTVNIALIEDRAPVFGLVYAPVTGQLYVTTSREQAIEATVDAGSNAGGIGDVDARPIAVRRPDPHALVALISRSHMNADTEAVLARYATVERRTAGSSLKFCLIANGSADFYPRIGPTSQWDTAAGHAVLRAAGGEVLMLDGRPLAYGPGANAYRNPDYVAWGSREALPPRKT